MSSALVMFSQIPWQSEINFKLLLFTICIIPLNQKSIFFYCSAIKALFPPPLEPNGSQKFVTAINKIVFFCVFPSYLIKTDLFVSSYQKRIVKQSCEYQNLFLQLSSDYPQRRAGGGICGKGNFWGVRGNYRQNSDAWF